MELWAAELYKNNKNVQFVCICVDPNPQVATFFSQMFRFQKVINTHIPSRDYMPRGYGQLGCSGFIVIDHNVCFISRRTTAYLQCGDVAFRDVEKLLARHHIYPTPQIQSIHPVVDSSVVQTGFNVSEQSVKIIELKPPASVGVARMDREHEECTDAFNALLQTPSSTNLQTLLLTLDAHFKHEENLMKKYEFGERKHDESYQQFSALSSHITDHQRILSIGRSELEMLQAKDEADC